MLKLFLRHLALLFCLAACAGHAQAQSTESSRANFMNARGVQDPFALVANGLNAAPNHFMREFAGLVQINVSSTQISGNGAFFTVSGTFDLQSLGNALANNRLNLPPASAGFRKAMQGATSMMGQVKLQNAQALPFSLTFSGNADNAGGSAVLTLPLVTEKFQTSALQKVGTTLGSTGLNLVFTISRAGMSPVGLSVGGSGNLFVLPSSHDFWVRLSPILSLDATGGLTVGSSISGSCGTRNFDEAVRSACDASWDVFGLGMLSTKGGSFLPTFDLKGNISAVTASIKDGRLGGVLAVDGALVLDVDATPGAGLVLNTTAGAGVQDTLRALTGKANNPAMTKLRNAVDKIPGVSGMTLSQSMEIVVAPFGFVYEKHNITGSMYKYATTVEASGARLGFSQELTGDVVGVLRGVRGAAPQGSMGVSVNFSNFYNTLNTELSKAGWLKDVLQSLLNSFKFNGGSANFGMNLAQGAEAMGKLDFEVFGKRFTPDVSLDVLADPLNKLVELLQKEAEVEVKKLFGMCDPRDESCQARNRKCTEYNTGYACVTQDWGGKCEARRVGADNYTCYSQQKVDHEAKVDRARGVRCTRDNVGASCLYGAEKLGSCKNQRVGADYYTCQP